MPGVAGAGQKHLIFSVDTEPDDELWTGLTEGHLTHENLRGLPELQNRMNALGVRATYLLSHSVAERGNLEKILNADLASGACEAGTHFHPGDTPPFDKTGRKQDLDNILRVPADLLEEKFANLHALVSARFGAPMTHRAGAWALDRRLLARLKHHGYKVDSSVTPGVSWKRNGRPSYLEAPMRAYPLPEGGLHGSGKGDSGILEVPVSIWSPRRWDGTLAGRLFGDVLTMPLSARRGILVRTVRALRPMPPQWLRPAFAEVEEMERTASNLEAEGAGYLHVMCHSNEIWPGTSPYCRSREDLDRFYGRLEGILRHALAQGYRPVTLAGYAAALIGSPGSPAGAPASR